MAHREDIKAFLEGIAVRPGDVVIDWGCGTKPVHNYIDCTGQYQYIGIDKLAHVDATIVADIEREDNFPAVPIADRAFCIEVLEHVLHPEVVLRRIREHLKPSGILYLSVPFLYPVHHAEDYWRFTDIGLRALLAAAGFTTAAITETTDQAGWICVALIGTKGI